MGGEEPGSGIRDSGFGIRGSGFGIRDSNARALGTREGCVAGADEESRLHQRRQNSAAQRRIKTPQPRRLRFRQLKPWHLQKLCLRSSEGRRKRVGWLGHVSIVIVVLARVSMVGPLARQRTEATCQGDHGSVTLSCRRVSLYRDRRTTRLYGFVARPSREPHTATASCGE